MVNIAVPSSAFVRVSCQNLDTLSSPVPFDTTITDRPTRLSEQSCNPTIAIATKLSGQFDHVGNQPALIRAPAPPSLGPDMSGLV